MAIITSNGTGGGNWSAGASWNGGVAPVLGTDSAVIANGDTITIDTTGLGCGTDPGAGIDGLTIQSGGVLNYATGANSDLTVRGCITIQSGGTLYDGVSQLGIAYTHILYIDCGTTAGKYALTREEGGIFLPHGADVLYNTTISSDVAASQANVVTTGDIVAGGWKAGDEVCLPPTGATANYTRTEKRTINAVSDATHFDVTSNWTYLHSYLQHASCPQTSIVNLTRNIRIQSLSATYPACVRNRGTVAADFAPKNVEFKNLGYSASIVSVVFCSTSFTTTPAYNAPAYGTMEGCSIHGETSAYVGLLLCMYNNTATRTFKDLIIIGNSTNVNITFQTQYNSRYMLFDNVYFWNSYRSESGVYFYYNFFLEVKNSVFAGGNAGIYNLSGNYCHDCFFHTNQYYQIRILGNKATLKDNFYINHYLGVDSANYNVTDEDSIYAGGTTYDINNIGSMILTNCVMTSGKEVNYANVADRVGIHKLNGTTDDHRTVKAAGIIYSCKSTFASPRDIVRTAGGLGMMFEPKVAATALTEDYEVAASNGKQIVVSGYFRRTAAYNGTAQPSITLSGVGITASTYTMAGAADAWELFTVSGTPTEDGIAKVQFSCIGTAGYVYIDDIVVTAADVNTGDLNNWIDGRPSKALFATKVDAAELATSIADAVWDEAKASHISSGSFGEHVGKKLAKKGNVISAKFLK